ncbi:hypothetical protein MIR68_005943 [Amoeboaphelidium protococcarum]|nr:hypothetical protein MIR68_005943 [Amoeboaphelidium protococcarum]
MQIDDVLQSVAHSVPSDRFDGVDVLASRLSDHVRKVRMSGQEDKAVGYLVCLFECVYEFTLGDVQCRKGSSSRPQAATPIQSPLHQQDDVLDRLTAAERAEHEERESAWSVYRRNRR